MLKSTLEVMNKVYLTREPATLKSNTRSLANNSSCRTYIIRMNDIKVRVDQGIDSGR